jgi:hypothetical protein
MVGRLVRCREVHPDYDANAFKPSASTTESEWRGRLG